MAESDGQQDRACPERTSDMTGKHPAVRHSPELPPPLVSPRRHPLRWAGQHLEMLALKAVLAYTGLLIVAALYYVLLETHVKLPLLDETNTQAWHRLVPERALRHDIRDVGEGLLGGLLGIAFTYNYFRRRRPPNRIDRIEIALRIPNVKDDRRLSLWQADPGAPADSRSTRRSGSCSARRSSAGSPPLCQPCGGNPDREPDLQHQGEHHRKLAPESDRTGGSVPVRAPACQGGDRRRPAVVRGATAGARPRPAGL